MSEMTAQEVAQWDKLIKRSSNYISHDFPHIDREELSQELWLWLLQQHNLKDPNRPGIGTIVNRKAKSIAWDLRKEELHWNDQYSYRTSDVKEILETVFFYNEWPDSFVPVDAYSRQNRTDMDSIDIRADVSWALSQLSRGQQLAIRDRYRDKIIHPAGSSRRRTLNHAVSRLTDFLNQYYRHNRRRRCITNAHARYIIENQENS